ncbi:hypothetical protein MTO96_005207 [Rhipicephalus appendiculatus]
MRTRQERNCRVRLERRAPRTQSERSSSSPKARRPQRPLAAFSPAALLRGSGPREWGSRTPGVLSVPLRVFWDANRPAALGFLPRPHDRTLTASPRRREGEPRRKPRERNPMRRPERERPAAPSAAAAVGLFDPVAALLLLRRRPHRCPPPGLPAAVCD